jgi:hypothetical protein
MKRVNQLLALAIVAVLLVPGFVFGALVEACCGVEPIDLLVEDSPDPVCVDDVVTISGTYTVIRSWTPPPPIEPYDTGVEIKIFDSAMLLVDEYIATLATGQPDPGDGVNWSFSHDWVPGAAGEYTYEVIAWSKTSYGRMQIDVVGETITVLESECPTIDCLVEQEIRDRWAAECPSCDEAKNHGAYVSCRANIVSGYVEAGLVDEEGSSCLINPEARTDCGKKK